MTTPTSAACNERKGETTTIPHVSLVRHIDPGALVLACWLSETLLAVVGPSVLAHRRWTFCGY